MSSKANDSNATGTVYKDEPKGREDQKDSIIRFDFVLFAAGCYYVTTLSLILYM
ncbi:MAG: hypothetical protein ACTHJ0_09220 [Flavipsychrobacter sp.]